MDWIVYGLLTYLLRTSSGVVGGGTALQAGRSGMEGLDSRWYRWKFSSTESFAMRSTQPPKEMNARYISWGIKAAGV